jgi:hypothetical protein
MVGGKVRQTIKDIGGTTPENLPPEKHIKELKNERKKDLKQLAKKKYKNRAEAQNEEARIKKLT